MSTVTASATAEVYTQAEHRIYAEHMDAENAGLRRHIDNKANALADRVKALETAQSDVHTIPSIREAQTRIYDELGEIKELCLRLDAVGISGRLDAIQNTQREHGETLSKHTEQLERHETAIAQLNGKALSELKSELKSEITAAHGAIDGLVGRVTELEKADGKKALKTLALVASAAITGIVGWILGALGIIGG